MLTLLSGIATFVFLMLGVVVSPVIFTGSNETALVLMSSLSIIAMAVSYIVCLYSIGR